MRSLLRTGLRESQVYQAVRTLVGWKCAIAHRHRNRGRVHRTHFDHEVVTWTLLMGTERSEQLIYDVQEDSSYTSSTSIVALSNEDLDPTPPFRRTWRAWHFFAFFWSGSFSGSGWTLGSAMVGTGLSWWQATIAIIIGNVLAAIVSVLNGRAASVYHIGFPVLVRASWGIYASYWAVMTRAMVAVIWFGVQTYYGGVCLAICLRCLAPSWERIPNHLPASAGITSADLLATFLFWLIELPFMFIHPSKIRTLFTIKSIAVPPACIGFWIWALVRSGGSGAFQFKNTASGSTLAWAILAALNNGMGYASATLVNQPDLSRYARNPREALMGQLIGYPLSNIIVGFLGLCVASASANIYGAVYWNVWDLMSKMLDESYTSGTRAGVFFVAFSFAFASLGINVGSNSLPFGSDVTALLPRYIDIRRGQLICWAIGMCILPWKMLQTATGFMTFLSGYAIFMAPIVGIMFADYFVVRRGNLVVEELYDTTKGSAYMYWHGINCRAIVAYVIGWILPLPGFIASFGTITVGGMYHVFELGWVVSCLMSFFTYWGLATIFPFADGDRVSRARCHADICCPGCRRNPYATVKQNKSIQIHSSRHERI
ncbi:hypothetical protein SAICODRAFT_37181 [Saitoella complicata NRRL Y-17804]|uniref:uncharacterized protein n=1 Tax=Saitoella complicata (strain BCRC 22490 / CBS 7301 / JCM 7358 / NBRC 10748 / NRRL Y-17804) TaxID=698492 RepID=UPI0008681501|nr:uncharacterized protein SAICODRAFT_37181 [Saitoella complicata NRRL Y-17804]ODQ50371.1 hypothetical protein SAICODRAFT_37181 [Saitoella complicata NRRL Y-17804]